MPGPDRRRLARDVRRDRGDVGAGLGAGGLVMAEARLTRCRRLPRAPRPQHHGEHHPDGAPRSAAPVTLSTTSVRSQARSMRASSSWVSSMPAEYAASRDQARAAPAPSRPPARGRQHQQRPGGHEQHGVQQPLAALEDPEALRRGPADVPRAGRQPALGGHDPGGAVGRDQRDAGDDHQRPEQPRERERGDRPEPAAQGDGRAGRQQPETAAPSSITPTPPTGTTRGGYPGPAPAGRRRPVWPPGLSGWGHALPDVAGHLRGGPRRRRLAARRHLVHRPHPGSAEVSDKLVPLLVVAAILGVITSFVKPVLKVLSFPFILLTLGLFLLVINAAAAAPHRLGRGRARHRLPRRRVLDGGRRRDRDHRRSPGWSTGSSATGTAEVRAGQGQKACSTPGAPSSQIAKPRSAGTRRARCPGVVTTACPGITSFGAVPVQQWWRAMQAHHAVRRARRRRRARRGCCS